MASDAFLLYRCYVVCMGKKSTVVLPALIYLATCGVSIVCLTVSSTLGAVYSTQDVQIAGTAAFSCSVDECHRLHTCFGTPLDTPSCHLQGSRSAAGSYFSYPAMTPESAALYTVFVIITLVKFTINGPLLDIFFPVSGTFRADSDIWVTGK
ncbi:hypothetical protein JVU11DRAFT_10322 [Chiua virens]|nr:hypothetical protein JVU11DRAFT_10322 [Chiua virens]